MILQLNRMSGCLFRKCKLVLMAVMVIGLSGCNISNDDGLSVQDEASVDLYANEMIFADVTPNDTCPVVTGQDVAGGGGPHVINFLLRKSEGLLLPALQAVQGHFQIKLCRTLTENYQFEWNLRINNKEGLGFTGWALVDAETGEELLGEQFSNKIESGRLVQHNGTMDVNSEFVVAPSDLRIVVTTTDPTQILIGLLLPAVQAGK